MDLPISLEIQSDIDFKEIELDKLRKDLKTNQWALDRSCEKFNTYKSPPPHIAQMVKDYEDIIRDLRVKEVAIAAEISELKAQLLLTQAREEQRGAQYLQEGAKFENLAQAQTGREAIRSLTRALKVYIHNNDDARASAVREELVHSWAALGEEFLQQNDYIEAEEIYFEALQENNQLNEDSQTEKAQNEAEICNKLAKICEKQRSHEEAVRWHLARLDCLVHRFETINQAQIYTEVILIIGLCRSIKVTDRRAEFLRQTYDLASPHLTSSPGLQALKQAQDEAERISILAQSVDFLLNEARYISEEHQPDIPLLDLNGKETLLKNKVFADIDQHRIFTIQSLLKEINVYKGNYHRQRMRIALAGGSSQASPALFNDLQVQAKAIIKLSQQVLTILEEL